VEEKPQQGQRLRCTATRLKAGSSQIWNNTTMDTTNPRQKQSRTPMPVYLEQLYSSLVVHQRLSRRARTMSSTPFAQGKILLGVSGWELAQGQKYGKKNTKLTKSHPSSPKPGQLGWSSAGKRIAHLLKACLRACRSDSAYGFGWWF